MCSLSGSAAGLVVAAGGICRYTTAGCGPVLTNGNVTIRNGGCGPVIAKGNASIEKGGTQAIIAAGGATIGRNAFVGVVASPKVTDRGGRASAPELPDGDRGRRGRRFRSRPARPSDATLGVEIRRLTKRTRSYRRESRET